MTAPGKPSESADLARIQDIEEKVISCIEVAAAATEQLSRIGNIDKAKVKELCSEFMNNIKAAQLLVQASLAKPANERSFEATSYQAQARAQIAAEKVRTVEAYLSGMSTCLKNSNDTASPPNVRGRPGGMVVHE